MSCSCRDARERERERVGESWRISRDNILHRAVLEVREVREVRVDLSRGAEEKKERKKKVQSVM
jgi:hypothetical protein